MTKIIKTTKILTNAISIKQNLLIKLLTFVPIIVLFQNIKGMTKVYILFFTPSPNFL